MNIWELKKQQQQQQERMNGDKSIQKTSDETDNNKQTEGKRTVKHHITRTLISEAISKMCARPYIQTYIQSHRYN